MKKAIVCALAALALVAAAQPLEERAKALLERKRETTAAAPGVTFETQLGVKQESSLLDVTLYFRYGETNLLGAVGAKLDMRREETVAQSIVEALLAGPDAAHDRLSGLFPQGTSVISVQSEGDTAFVTLNQAFLGIPDGAPADWEDLAGWQAEATLRRRLAFQSIVLALTEDGRYQRVQLYVAGGDDEVPRRIPLYWFDQSATNPNVMLAACARDEQAMLTPNSARRLSCQAAFVSSLSSGKLISSTLISAAQLSRSAVSPGYSISRRAMSSCASRCRPSCTCRTNVSENAVSCSRVSRCSKAKSALTFVCRALASGQSSVTSGQAAPVSHS